MRWRSITKDNILTLYGKDSHSRIADPGDPTHVFSWLICETRDDKGNAVVYEYKSEDGANVDLTQAHERNRGDQNSPLRKANRYLKRIRYGNRTPLLDNAGHRPRFLTQADIDNAGWMFEVVFDYAEGHYQALPNDAEGREYVTASTSESNDWLVRTDPFSSYRAGFEVRTYRLCRRVLMFHHFPAELGVADCLVRSTEFTYDEQPIASFITGVTQAGYVLEEIDTSKSPCRHLNLNTAKPSSGKMCLKSIRLISRTCPMAQTVPLTSGSISTVKASRVFLRNRAVGGSTNVTSRHSPETP